MRARALVRPPRERAVPAALSSAALVFLRGRDADGRLRELTSARGAARPVLGALSAALLDRRAYEALGYRSLGDYGREHLGVGARTVREWARVWRRLAELPRLRQALQSGEVGWEVARRVVGLATPETEAACLATVRGRTVRAVEAIVAAVRDAAGEASPGEGESEAERVPVRLGCTPREALLWSAALELARRVAGEELPVWECAERIAAEAASAAPRPAPGEQNGEKGIPRESACGARPDRSGRSPEAAEPGLRDDAFPTLRWSRVSARRLAPELEALAEGLDGASPRELDRRLRAAIGFLQGSTSRSAASCARWPTAGSLPSSGSRASRATPRSVSTPRLARRAG